MISFSRDVPERTLAGHENCPHVRGRVPGPRGPRKGPLPLPPGVASRSRAVFAIGRLARGEDEPVLIVAESRLSAVPLAPQRLWCGVRLLLCREVQIDVCGHVDVCGHAASVGVRLLSEWPVSPPRWFCLRRRAAEVSRPRSEVVDLYAHLPID